jgi:hypothetical protein
MATPEEVARLQSEWETEGVPQEEIGKRIARLADEAEAAAEQEQEPAAEQEPEPEHRGAPDPEWPLCPVCAGAGRVPPELAPSQDKGTCPECNGLGKVRTGSLVPDHAFADCATCGGYGYTSFPRQYEPPAPEQPQRDWSRTY